MISRFLKKYFYFFLQFIFFTCAFFLINFAATADVVSYKKLPSKIQITHPIWQDTLVQSFGSRYCRLSQMWDCGEIQNFTDDLFDFVWEKWSTERFKKGENNIYVIDNSKTDLRVPIPAPILPKRADKSFFIDNKIYLLHQDSRGNCFDKMGNYMGHILTENEITLCDFLNKSKDGHCEKTDIVLNNLIFLDKNGQKQVWKQFPKNNYYILSEYQPASFKKNKILIFMPSFKRPMFLSGQILRMMNQSYQNFDFAVSVKGVNKQIIQEVFMPEWDLFIQKKHLFVRIDPNKNQFSNVLDPLRDIDLNQYDYFCRIDDDDWYSPHYLEDVNDHLNTYPNIVYSDTRTYYIVSDKIHSVNFEYSTRWWEGPTQCMSQEVMKKAFELEKMSESEREKQYLFLKNFGYYISEHEDLIFLSIGLQNGFIQKRSYSTPLTVYGNQYPSVTRNEGYVELQSELFVEEK